MKPGNSIRQQENIADICAKFCLSDSDLELIREAGTLLDPHMPEFVEQFYVWLRPFEAFRSFFGEDGQALQRVKVMQETYWRRFFKADITQDYIDNRRHIGTVHAQIDLPNDIYCAGMAVSLDLLGKKLHSINPASADLDAMICSISKLVMMDNFLVLDEIVAIQKDRIVEHSRVLIEVATPVTLIWDGILLLPLIGIVDSSRANDIMEKVLGSIVKEHAQAFILDITGVATVDTAVANQFIRISKATSLMGCQSIISGISPAISRTLVELGIALGDVKTTATLKDALNKALGIVLQGNQTAQARDARITSMFSARQSAP